MKNLKIAFLVVYVAGIVALTLNGGRKRVEAAGGQSELVGGSEGMYFAQVRSTGAKVFDLAGTVYRIELSSGNNAATLDYALLIDTSASANGFVQANVVTATIITPALIFTASTTTNGQMTVKDYQPYGIRVANGLYVLKTTINSGEAFVLNVYYRR